MVTATQFGVNYWSGLEAVALESRYDHHSIYDLLLHAAREHGDRPALSFQLKPSPKAPAVTFSYTEYAREVTRAANLFRSLGLGPEDAIACLMPNTPQTAFALLGGMTAGIVVPVNPLLSSEQIAGILRDSGARMLVTLAPFPKTDLAEKAAAACAGAPGVEVLLEVDLQQYLRPPVSWLVPLLRPKVKTVHRARVLDFDRERGQQPGYALVPGPRPGRDTISAYFHTGGTTGLPKLARHRQSGMLYAAWAARQLLYRREDVILCALPLFHVFAAYAMAMAALGAGSHVVLLCPAGFRTEGIMDQFWKLVERWQATFMMAVPTVFAALRDRPVDAEVSTLRFAVSGAAPMPRELFRTFEEATGLKILEGYGQTESTCVISVNPPEGERRLGSVGQALPYTQVRALRRPVNPEAPEFCAPGEVGEIATRGPHVFPGYVREQLNAGCIVGDGWLCTGDLGRVDEENWIWLTGRAKDLIIRGGHNIDPEVVEEALAAHPEVAVAAAVGRPDATAGELPVAFVQLVGGGSAGSEELCAFAAERVGDAAARPVSVQVLDEIPTTAVGKVFKPALRKIAVIDALGEALAGAGVKAKLEMIDDPEAGLVAVIEAEDGDAVERVLAPFAVAWRLAGAG